MPRTGRPLDVITGTGGTSSSGVPIADLSNCVKKSGEESQTIQGDLNVTGSVTAYAIGEEPEIDIPLASKSTYGQVMVGNGIDVTNGVISVAGGGGGGIDDVNVVGDGNALTNLSVASDGKTLTATKGTTFATSSGLSAHTGDSNIHVTSTNKNEWNTAYLHSHTHSNKSFLDVINQGLSTSSNVTFNNLNANGDVKAYGSVTAYAIGSGGYVDFPIATTTQFGAVKPSTGLTISAGVLKSTIHSVQRMDNSSNPTSTHYSEIKIKSGYRNLSGSIAAGAFASVLLWDCTLSNTLSVTANFCMMNNYVGAALVTNIMQDNGNNCYRIVIYNPTGAAISVDGQRVYYTAMTL